LIHVKKQLLIFEKQLIQWKNELNNCKKNFFLLNFLFLIINFRRTTEHRQITNGSNQYENFLTTTNNNTDHRVRFSFKNIFHYSIFLVHSRTLSFMY